MIPPLFTLLRDDDERCRVKALLALSCMVRGDTAALEAFRAQHGVTALVGLLAPDTQPPRVQRCGCSRIHLVQQDVCGCTHRKALQLLQYVFGEVPKDAVAVMSDTPLQHVAGLASRVGDSGSPAEAALDLLAQLATVREVQPRLQVRGMAVV